MQELIALDARKAVVAASGAGNSGASHTLLKILVQGMDTSGMVRGCGGAWLRAMG